MKTALITGASSGIGLELAKIFAAKGYNLVLTARSEKKLLELCRDIRADVREDTKITVLPLDLSLPDAPDELFAATEEKGIRVHTLVNNAGYGDFGEFHQADWAKTAGMIALNITALTHLSRLYAPGMVTERSGAILNVASTAAFQPGPLMAVYYATKAYVLSFSQAIANELKDCGVTVTALCPGPTESGFQQGAAMEDSKLVKGKKMPTAQEVAEYGFRAVQKGKTVAVHGMQNYLLAQSTRLMPRKFITNVVRKMQEPQH